MITILLVCIFLYGVKIRVHFNADDMQLIIAINIFGFIRLGYIKILLYNARLYYKVNNGVYRPIEIQKNSKMKVKIDTIYIRKLLINSKYNDPNDKITPLVYAMLGSMAIDFAPILLQNKVNIDHIQKNIVPYDFDQNFYIDVTIILGLKFLISLAQIISSQIRLRREKNGNRQYD